MPASSVRGNRRSRNRNQQHQRRGATKLNHDLISAEAEAEQTDVSLRVKRPTILLRRESVRNVWGHDIADGLDWTAALSREYWASVIEKFRPGDHVDIHSFDHRIQFTMLVFDTNTSTDPIYFDIAFLPVYPADFRLPVLPPSGHCWEARTTARSVGFDTFVLFGDQAPVSLATTVKLGRASAGLVVRTALNAATGRRRPFSSRFPRSSSLATPSTASAIRLLIRIWPSFASAQSRAARLQTVPIAV